MLKGSVPGRRVKLGTAFSKHKRCVLNVAVRSRDPFWFREQMSFARVGRPLQHSKGRKAARPKKTAPKKEWVVSIVFHY